MKVYVGADHAGFELKQKLVAYLKEGGHQVVDEGAHELNEGDDYPDFIALVAKAVSLDTDAVGVILGGSGQGEAIVANRFPGVRASVYYGGPKDIITLSREHNDANILSLGARFIGEKEAKETVGLWLRTPFSGEERHKRRIKKIDDIETYAR
ncbi:MAG: ribose-5-phosphate isomerase [Patescibacteria group bacterium]|nr:MAG: ribose-5-phosphate isomerase [Patescibacteria group bacterium]